MTLHGACPFVQSALIDPWQILSDAGELVYLLSVARLFRWIENVESRWH